MEKQPLQILTKLKRVGILDHLSTDEITAVEDRVERVDTASPILTLNVLQAIPDVVFCPEHGSRNRELREPAAYPQTFKQLESIAHDQLALALDGLAPHNWGIVYAVNQTLAQLDRDERFYWIEYPDDGVNGPLRGWALIYLSYPQFKQMMQSKVLRLSASYSWSKTRVDDVIDTLEKLGLLAHLSKAEINDNKRRILDTDIGDRSLAAVLDVFGLVYWVDAEMIYDINEDYMRLFAGTSQLFRGVFIPNTVRVGELDSDQYFTVSFIYEGRAFSKRIEHFLDWINWDYLALINSALASTGKDQRYCLLESRDQTAPIIFLRGDQLAEIKDKNILPLNEKWDPFSESRGG
jgi:hypothetical protein